jgi:hypothetical protein
MQGFKPAFSGVFPKQAGFLLPVSLPGQSVHRRSSFHSANVRCLIKVHPKLTL